jgi:alpha-glucosidase
MNIKRQSIVLLALACIANITTANIAIQRSTLVGDRIVEFIPVGFDKSKTPSLILNKEPTAIGNIPIGWLQTIKPALLSK